MEITQQVLLWGFGIAFVMGAVVNKTNFCTMGAVSDLVNMGDSGRFRAWLFALTVAMIGVVALEATSAFSVASTLPPYRAGNFTWIRYLVGGVMFGVGMTLGSGCGNKTLIRIGGGNAKSLVVLAVIAVCAYYMMNPFNSETDATLYSTLFHGWVTAAPINFSVGQDLGGIVAGLSGAENVGLVRTVVGGIVAALLLAFIFKSRDFRGNWEHVLGGTVVGLSVLAAWYVTGGPLGVAWSEAADFMDQPPLGVATQSFTFINPIGESLRLAFSPKMQYVTFGVAAVAGVIAGSFFWSLVSRSLRFEWFNSLGDFLNHFVGAVLMGIGGVLAMGCTIGQGITGASTLALGSLLTFVSIVFGSAITMKVQFYKMAYEEEASFVSALITGLVDFRLLPAGMRRHEPF
ncbi:YeeE/YedE family protein [Endothiovibrio diazotrophicus]